MSHHRSLLFRFILSLLVSHILFACTQNRAWITSQEKSLGRIGYYESSFFNDREAMVKDFKKQAYKICGSNNWVVVREILPPPIEGVSAIRNGASGDIKGATYAAGHALISDDIRRSKRFDKTVKVEYGSPLHSWNEAEIKCEKAGKS